MREQTFGKIRRSLAILLVFCFLVSLTAMAVNAATLSVGSKGQYTTIQVAINSAKSGDTIKVSSGTYAEIVDISGKRITIQGIKYPTVDGFSVHDGGSATISGFKIIGYHGILSLSGKNTIKNNKFESEAIGIYIDNSKGHVIPTVTSNTFKKCSIAAGFSTCPVPSKLGTFNKNTYTNCAYKFYCDPDLD
jgi:parallel beta-helix repeat protein